MNRSPRKYIPTKELINQLGYLGYEKMSLQTFRNKIIAKLRDNDVIISSSKEGYKIPTTEEELDDFINHGKTIIMPMLSRLKKCNDVIRMGTNGEIKLFEKAEFSELASMIESHN
jgi:transcriptional regulator of heat shock response